MYVNCKKLKVNVLRNKHVGIMITVRIVACHSITLVVRVMRITLLHKKHVKLTARKI